MEPSEEIAMKRDVLNFVANDFSTERADRRIRTVFVEQTVVGFRDEFRNEKDLDVELQIHQRAEAAKDTVDPVFSFQFASEIANGTGEQGGVLLFFGNEKINRFEVEVLRSVPSVGFPFDKTAQTGSAPAFAQLKCRQRVGKESSGLFSEPGRTLIPVWFLPVGVVSVFFESGNPVSYVHEDSILKGDAQTFTFSAVMGYAKSRPGAEGGFTGDRRCRFFLIREKVVSRSP